MSVQLDQETWDHNDDFVFDQASCCTSTFEVCFASFRGSYCGVKAFLLVIKVAVVKVVAVPILVVVVWLMVALVLIKESMLD